jgi:hypothetical protein
MMKTTMNASFRRDTGDGTGVIQCSKQTLKKNI